MSLDIACQDSICALSTPPGHGALAIVRLSGPKSIPIFSAVFRKHHGELKHGSAMHGLVLDKDGNTIDDVMAILWKDERSFTGEPCAEIYCHGNPLIIDQILSAMKAQGARLANPGEFSMRAMLNGKIDLAQAESIADVIHAETSAAKDAALKGLKGSLREKTLPVQEMIIQSLAEIEARMDFPDEELGDYDKSHLLGAFSDGIDRLEKLLSGASYGIKLHEGARVIIVGAPNAGKSTLLNQLCQEEKAIVHDSAGTTRDVIEVRIDLDGLPLTIVDVAGIRELHEASPVEQIGINKALLEIDRAHAIIWLVDGSLSEPFSDPLLKERLQHCAAPIIRVLNKVDLLEEKPAGSLAIAAKHGDGIVALKDELKRHLLKERAPSEIFITRARQRDELYQSLDSLKTAKNAFEEGLVDEVVSAELRAAGLAFDRLFGFDLSERILDKIFSEFCIGK